MIDPPLGVMPLAYGSGEPRRGRWLQRPVASTLVAQPVCRRQWTADHSCYQVVSLHPVTLYERLTADVAKYCFFLHTFRFFAIGIVV